LSLFVPAMTIAWLVCRLARGAGLSWNRATLACLPILAFCFLFVSSLEVGELDGESSVLMMGFNLPFAYFFQHAFGKASWAMPMVWAPLGHLALPLCVMLWMFVRERALAAAILVENAESGDLLVTREAA
jgi:hypothetical protein